MISHTHQNRIRTPFANPILNNTPVTSKMNRLVCVTALLLSKPLYGTSAEADKHWPEGELNCAQGFREFDQLTQKETYFVGVHAENGIQKAFQEYNMTFETYLNEAVGKRWDPPIEFVMKVSDHPLKDWIDNREEIDFMYTDTGVFSCIGTEIGAQPFGTTIARMTARGRQYDLDVFAGQWKNTFCLRLSSPCPNSEVFSFHYVGTMLVLANNKDISTVQDLKGKIIGAHDFSEFASAQSQFYVMKKNGLDYIVDPKQVIFTGTWLLGCIHLIQYPLTTPSSCLF